MTRYVFTITAGRTGTAWLAQLFGANLDCVAHHEFLNFGEFGIRSQDVGLMGAFNHWGNGERVQQFWRRKFGLIPDCGIYVETNHALAKCGLIENLELLPEGAEVSIITLQREWLAQAMSYLRRYDFYNMSTVWLWYLDMRYQNRIVSPAPFTDKGVLGQIAWYMAEVEARQAYYRQMFGERYTFIDAKMEEVTTEDGARALLEQFGHNGAVEMPEKANANPATPSPIDETQVRAFINRLKFDPEDLARKYILSGRRLDIRGDSVPPSPSSDIKAP